MSWASLKVPARAAINKKDKRSFSHGAYILAGQPKTNGQNTQVESSVGSDGRRCGGKSILKAFCPMFRGWEGDCRFKPKGQSKVLLDLVGWRDLEGEASRRKRR